MTSLPADTLGTMYYAMTWENVPELMVVAVEDSTTVSFTFPSPSTAISFTYSGTTYGNGETLTVTLNRHGPPGTSCSDVITKRTKTATAAALVGLTTTTGIAIRITG